MTTDHLRTCTGDHALMARVAAVHALGDIWAMGARPEAALAQVILPEMTPVLQSRWMAEIMSAAADVFGREGAKIIGGHTTQGAELTIGFTVTGQLDRPAIRLSGAQVGDALILTKPLGAGVLLAAEARQLANGHDIALLWRMLTQSQARAAAILRGHANAMTDVTGFGLAGHLGAICHASATGADINLAAVPLYRGATALAMQGVRSSIFGENFKNVMVNGPQDARFDLLFDPQTSGGLLAAVPKAKADILLRDLQQAGYTAATIGQITSGLTIRAQ